jgi:hypothetical protein
MKTKPFLFGFFLVAGLVPAQAAQFGDFQYTSTGTAVNITKYTGPGGAVTIPDTIQGMPVTSIGEYAFNGCTGLTSVVIPDSVTSIGDQAFFGCTGLTSITIPDSVTSIGEWAFAWCTGLTSITMPNSVTSIGRGAFSRCSGLTSIDLDPRNAAYSSLDGVVFNKSQTELIACPGGKAGNYTIPSSVTSIGYGSFILCTGLTSITIPDSVISIGRGAFGGCTGLTGITIPDSVTSIGDEAFYGCTGLTSITIPDSVTSIGDWAFADCTGLTTITIPSGLTRIGYEAFSGCTILTRVFIKGDWSLPWSGHMFEGSPTILYRRPGALNWATTVAGRPTALWIPLTLSDALATSSARLSLATSSPPPSTVHVQRSTNLRDWEDWQTVSRDSGPSGLHDADASTVPVRFYRVVEE